MGTLTGSRNRTITGHIAHLLDYPKWLIGREVDFTHCDFDGHYDDAIVQCTECQFSAGCRWLDDIRDIDTCQASISELTAALNGAVCFVAGHNKEQHHERCDCEQCAWLNSARRLLRSMSR